MQRRSCGIVSSSTLGATTSSRASRCRASLSSRRSSQTPGFGRKRFDRAGLRSRVHASAEETGSSLESLDDLAVVKKVALAGKVFQQISAREMFESLVPFNKIKAKDALRDEDLLGALAKDSDDVGAGSFWKLVFTVSKNNVIEATSKGPSAVKGNGGSFFPVTAVQNWSKATMRIQNGIFILGVFALVFSGDFEVKDRILYFDFDRLDVKLGPLGFGFDLPPNEERQGKKRPFLVFLHADEEICIAKGRGGGLAVWKKVDKAYREDEGAYV